MRRTYRLIDFTFKNLPGWQTGPPKRGILHTDDNPRPHTALGALQWGDRERAFSIHYYVEGDTVYRAIPETWQAFHVKEHRKAAARSLATWAPGLDRAKPRGDVHAIGIEHVMNPDGSWDQDTRLTSVLLAADIQRRWPKLQWSEHAEWDPWTRANDVGVALWVPDWIADVREVLEGRDPYWVVGPQAGPRPYAGPPPTDEADREDRIEELERTIADLSGCIDRAIKVLSG